MGTCFLSRIESAFRALIVSLCIITSFQLCGEEFRYEGVILDNITGKPIRSVAVSLHRVRDTVLIKGGLTNAKGQFSFQVSSSNNQFLVKVRRLGYMTRILERSLDKKSDLRDTIQLIESAITQSDGVDVIGWREFTEILPDKKVYTIKDNPNINGTTVSEILDQIPSIQVDQDGTIRLRGDESVTIMIDNRPIKMDEEAKKRFLQQLPSQSIEKVEVRTIAGATFDAKIGGSMINLISARGLMDYAGGSVSMNSNSIGRLGGSGTFVYQDSTIASSINIGYIRMPNVETISMLRTNTFSASERTVRQSIENKPDHKTFYANLQTDFSVSPNDALSLAAYFNNNPGITTGTGANETRNEFGTIERRFYDTADVQRSGIWGSASLLYKHTFPDQSKLSILTDYSIWTDNRTDNRSSIWTTQSIETDTARSLIQRIKSSVTQPSISGQVQYEFKPDSSITLEIGAKYERTWQNNSVETLRYSFGLRNFLLDSLASLSPQTFTTTSAGFISAGFQLGANWTLQTGVRFESSTIGADFGTSKIERTYPYFFPSASLGWNPSQTYSFSLSYQRSIYLPWTGILNPKVTRDATSDNIGNADIKPEFVNTMELSANGFWGAFSSSFSLYARRTEGDISRSNFMVGTVQRQQYVNFNGTIVTGVDLSANWRSASGITARAGLHIENYHNIGSSIPSDTTLNSLWWSCNTGITYSITDDFSTTVSTRYTSPYDFGGQAREYFVTSQLSALYKLFDKALTLQLNFSDPLFLQRSGMTTYSSGWQQIYESRNLSRTIALNITFSFGKGNVNMERHEKDRTGTKGG
jgi:outer membrane receptor for ferrienterochelin and colicins